MQPSPPTPPGINDSNDSIEDEVPSSFSLSLVSTLALILTAVKAPHDLRRPNRRLLRGSRKILEKREERTKKDLSLSL